MILDLFIDERHQSYHALTYVLPADDPKASLAVEDHEVSYGGEVYYIDQIEEERDGASATLRVTANALWMRLAGPKRVGSFVLTAVDAASGLDLILDGTGWTRGTNVETASGGVTSLQTLEAQDASVLDLVWRWAKLFNLEVQFDTVSKVVDFVPEVGAELGLSFRYGRNLTRVKRTARVPEATRVYAYGRDDLTISGVNPSGAEYVEDLSFYTAQGLSEDEARANRKDEVLSDFDIVDELSLYRRALSRLAVSAQPFVRYEASVVDLSELLGTDEYSFGVGDTVRVYDSVFNWNFRTRVVRRLRYPLEPWRDEIELSNLDEPANSLGQSFRPSSTRDWNLFKKDSSEYRPLEGGTYTLNRIGVAFVEGEAVFGYDLNFTGVGTGTLSVSALDAVADELVHPVLSIDFEDGEAYHENATWALQGLTGQKDYRVRMTATGGTVRVGEGDSRFWILARGATQRTPRLPNSERFDFVSPAGGVQQFTVPDDVTEVTIECAGSVGGEASIESDLTVPGGGGIITATFAVVPGTVYDVYVGGVSWPNGGVGDTTPSGNTGGRGGGSSHVVPAGGSYTSALVLAGGGGGAGYRYGAATFSGNGGAGGLFQGGAANGGIGATGATQFAGGTGFGTGSSNGAAFDGGDAGNTTSGFAEPGGGGGGGWYGGGSAGEAGFNGANGGAGGGGGGSGWVDASALDVIVLDGGNTEEAGYVVFSWETPDD